MTRLLSFCLAFLGSYYLLSTPLFAQEFSPKNFKEFTNYKDNILATKFSSKNSYLAIAAKDNSVELRDRNFATIWTYKNNPNNYGMNLAFSLDEKHLAFSKYQSRQDVAVLDIAQKKVIQKLKTGGWPVLEYSPDGKFLVTSGRSREAHTAVTKIWTWKGGKYELVQTLKFTHKRFQGFRDIGFSADGQFFALSGITGHILIYRLRKGKFEEHQQVLRREWSRAIAFHPDGKNIVLNVRNRIFHLQWKGGKRNGKFVYVDSLKTYGGKIWKMKFDPKGKYLVTACVRSGLRVYQWDKDKLSREEEDSYDLHVDGARSMDMNKGLLVSGGADKKVVLYTLGKVPVAMNNIGSKITPKTKKTTHNKGAGSDVFSGDDLDIDVGGKGKNYLFVVGIKKYRFWDTLSNAASDARKVKAVLQKRYGFEEANTVEIYNEQATIKNILSKLSELRMKITPKDNLLLYYSGHGFYNAAIEEGFWIPFNAKKGEETQYLANSTLLKYIKAIKAKHVFLVADACFSGSLFSAGKRGYIENVERFKSRWGLASGRLEFVSDGDVGKSSPFANYFLKYLTTNTKKRFPISELIQYVKVSVSNNANQTPIGHPLKNVGDEGGEFVFYLNDKK